MNIKKFYTLFISSVLFSFSISFKSTDILGNINFPADENSFAESKGISVRFFRGILFQYEFEFTNDGDAELEK